MRPVVGKREWSMATGAGHVRAPKCSTVGQQQVVALILPLFFSSSSFFSTQKKKKKGIIIITSKKNLLFSPPPLIFPLQESKKKKRTSEGVKIWTNTPVSTRPFSPPPPSFLHRLFNNPVVVKRRKYIWKGKISREPSKWRVRERNKKCHRIKLVFKVSDKDVCVCVWIGWSEKNITTHERTNERWILCVAASIGDTIHQ